MKTLKFNSREEWMRGRIGKVTGSRAGDVTLKKNGDYKKGFYELIAERVAIPDADGVPANPLERGHYLEPIAIERFTKETGKKVNTDLVIWAREDNENIAVSPDGVIGKTEVIECKSLASASHLEAWIKKAIPSEYEEQYVQYFVVNDKLKKLYFAFYDPRIPAKDFFYFTVNRKDIEDKIKEQLESQREILAKVEEFTNELTF
jgi:predicted phage-related endonuclease